MKPKLLLAFVLVTLFALGETPERQKARCVRLEESVLAPCCYKEPVSRHGSAVSARMKIQIADWVAQGRTDSEILGEFSKLYGAKVLVDPNTAPREWTYLVPWAVLLLGAVMASWILWRWRAVRLASATPASGPPVPIPEMPDLDEY